jgi:hypothetical protein
MHLGAFTEPGLWVFPPFFEIITHLSSNKQKLGHDNIWAKATYVNAPSFRFPLNELLIAGLHGSYQDYRT